MKEFNLEEARKMSHEEIMGEVCEGLSEVCVLLAAKSKTKAQKQALRHDAKVFTVLAQVFRKQETDAEFRARTGRESD